MALRTTKPKPGKDTGKDDRAIEVPAAPVPAKKPGKNGNGNGDVKEIGGNGNGGSVLRPVGGGGRGNGNGNGSGGNGGGGGGGGKGPVPPGIPPANEPKPPKPRIKKLRILFIVAGLGVLAVASSIFGMFMAVSQDLPAIEKYSQFKAAQNTIVTDSQGQTIGTLSSNENRILLDPAQISPNMKNAVVSVEDARFYEHRGVDFQGLGRALVQDVITHSASQGASTITQQLVKQALEAQNDRTVLQKVREIALAYHIEQKWTKDKILTEYLNTVYFGSGAYGVEAAARTYFKSAHPGCGTDTQPCASVLTPPEAALLAGIIQNPYGYDPKLNPEAALLRRNVVLQKMLEQGFISQEQYDDGIKEALPAASEISPPKIESEAPYFTSWLRQQLVDRYGAGRAFFGGLKVKSTLDMGLQTAAQDVVTNTLSGIGPSAAAVIINNKDATIKAMVSGSDYDTAPFNLATQGFRQPGSTIKAFILTTALQQGISPDAVYASAPQEFHFGRRGKETFVVKNYGGEYAGSRTLRDATTYSDNSIYAQVGLESIKGGPKAIAHNIHKMGESDHIGTNPAMVLGTSEVTPLEWTYAWTTLANDGTRVSGSLAPDPGDDPVAYTKVTDSDGKVIKGGENKVIKTQVIDPEVVQTAKGILATVVSSGTGKNAYIGDASQFGKTGTTEDNGNAWFCGAITEVTACVWVGYADKVIPMTTEYNGGPVDGGTFPAIIWAQLIEAWKANNEQNMADAAARKAARQAGNDTSGTTDSTSTDTTTPYVAPTTTTPAPTTVTPTAPAPAAPAPTAPAPAAPVPTTPTTPSTGTGGAGTGGASPG